MGIGLTPIPFLGCHRCTAVNPHFIGNIEAFFINDFSRELSCFIFLQADDVPASIVRKHRLQIVFCIAGKRRFCPTMRPWPKLWGVETRYVY